MIERRENLPLVAKALDDEVVVETGVYQLNGHAMAELSVSAPGLVHRAHSAVADFAFDAIRPHLEANHRFTTICGGFSFIGISNFGLIVHAIPNSADILRETNNQNHLIFVLMHPFRVPREILATLSGGLRCAATTGYSLAALRSAD